MFESTSHQLSSHPDGSLKWTGHALPASSIPEDFHLAPGEPTEPESPVSVSDSSSSVTVTTGSFSATFNKSGDTLISSLSLNGQNKGQNGKLLIYVQSAPDQPEVGGSKPDVGVTTGNIEAVTVEQDGPVRAVIKVSMLLSTNLKSKITYCIQVTGKYSGDGHDAFLPFIVRFYISAGTVALRIVHFWIYDGDQSKDFIKGIVSYSAVGQLEQSSRDGTGPYLPDPLDGPVV